MTRLNWERAAAKRRAKVDNRQAETKVPLKRKRRRRRRKGPFRHCQHCGCEFEPQHKLEQRSGVCMGCGRERGEARRKRTAERLLAKGKVQGTVEREGKTYTVIELPPKRRGGWRR